MGTKLGEYGKYNPNKTEKSSKITTELKVGHLILFFIKHDQVLKWHF